MLYTQKQLEKCLNDAFSYENREGWGKEHLDVEHIGTVQRGSRIYSLYVDSENNYWYKLFFMTEAGIITEYEKVFCPPERRKQAI